MAVSLSVIVPVWNQAAYLEHCVDSILEQMESLQLILVDDGSTDGSGEICDSYAARDRRITVIHKPNGGILSARKSGISAARGELLAFVDADDWLEPGYFKNLALFLYSHSQVDMVAGSMVRVYADGSCRAIFPRAEKKLMEKDEALGEMLRQRHFGWHLAGKVYRRSLFEGWQPNESIVSGEDLHGNYLLLSRARQVASLPGSAYCYRENPTGLTRRTTMELDLTPVYEHMLANLWVRESNVLNLLLESYLYDLVRQYREMFFTDSVAYKEKLLAYALRMEQLVGKIKAPVLFAKEQLEFYRQKPEALQVCYEKARCAVLETARVAFASGLPVYLYGAGIAAKCYLLLLAKERMICAGCVVSDGQVAPSAIQGVRVFHLSEISQEAVFLLALNGRYVPQVMETLAQAGHKNVFHHDEPQLFAGLAIG